MKLFPYIYASCIVRFGKRMRSRLGPFKRELFSALSGTVVEIGPGAGENTRHFPPAVSEYVGVEPNPFLREAAFRESHRIPGCTMEFLNGEAEDLPLPEESADAVVATFVLCSVGDVPASVAEIIRILKPGGKFVFIEHVGAPEKTFARALQNKLTPLSRRCCGNCHWNRDILAALREGRSQLGEAFRSITPYTGLVTSGRPLGPLAAGIAVK